MEELIAHYVVPFLQNLFVLIGWPGVVIIMALESANIPIPSEMTMPLAGWLLIDSSHTTWLQAFMITGFIGALGCLIGSTISYWLGYWGGRPLVERYGKYILVSKKDIENFDRWFQRWGQTGNFVARLLPIVRTFISFPAGVFRISFWPFAVLTFVGSFIWCGLLALGGYYFGEHWEELRAIMRPFDIPIAIVLLAGFGYYVYHHIKRAQRPAPPEQSCE